MDFKNWLNDYSIIRKSLIKTYAIKYCRALCSSNMVTCIELIYRRFIDISNLGIEFLNPQQLDNLTNTQRNIAVDVDNENCENCENSENSENGECNVCYEKFEKKKFVKLNCKHEFCKGCINQILKKQDVIPRCPYCRTRIIPRKNVPNQQVR